MKSEHHSSIERSLSNFAQILISDIKRAVLILWLIGTNSNRKKSKGELDSKVRYMVRWKSKDKLKLHTFFSMAWTQLSQRLSPSTVIFLKGSVYHTTSLAPITTISIISSTETRNLFLP